MACPYCQTPSPINVPCTACASALTWSAPAGALPAFPWSRNPTGRLLIGIGLSAGLCYGFLQIAGAGLRAAAGADFQPPPALVLGILSILAAIAVAVGVAVMAAGQRRPLLWGLVGGILSAGVGASAAWVLMSRRSALSESKLSLAPMAFSVLAGGLGLAGLVGGWLGGTTWPGSDPLRAGALGPATAPRIRLSSDAEPPVWIGPVHWFRAALGIAFAIGGGVLGSGAVIRFIRLATDGAVRVETAFQHRIVTIEVFALAMILGAALAGAASRSGLKQGLVVGLGTAAAIVGLLSLGSFPYGGSVEPFAFAAVFLGPLGGWFGAELLPPVPSGGRRHRLAWWR